MSSVAGAFVRCRGKEKLRSHGVFLGTLELREQDAKRELRVSEQPKVHAHAAQAMCRIVVAYAEKSGMGMTVLGRILAWS